MTASHSFTEPRDPFSYWAGEEPDTVGLDAYCVLASATDLRRCQGVQLADHLADLVEAREALNDAIAKAEAHRERAGMDRLPFGSLH
jgi:hypothetical protein